MSEQTKPFDPTEALAELSKLDARVEGVTIVASGGTVIGMPGASDVLYGTFYGAWRIAKNACAALSGEREARETLEHAVRWALGEEGEFPSAPDELHDRLAAGKMALGVRGPSRLYWWRSALRERAFGAAQSGSSVADPKTQEETVFCLRRIAGLKVGPLHSAEDAFTAAQTYARNELLRLKLFGAGSSVADEDAHAE